MSILRARLSQKGKRFKAEVILETRPSRARSRRRLLPIAPSRPPRQRTPPTRPPGGVSRPSSGFSCESEKPFSLKTVNGDEGLAVVGTTRFLTSRCGRHFCFYDILKRCNKQTRFRGGIDQAFFSRPKAPQTCLGGEGVLRAASRWVRILTFFSRQKVTIFPPFCLQFFPHLFPFFGH